MEKVAKTEILRYYYPLNLLKAIEAKKTQFEIIVDTITEDQKEGLEYALSQLTERERQILRMRYQERKTLREIGTVIGVTAERIRSQEHHGIYRLRKPPLLGYIKYGKATNEKLVAEKKAEKEKEYNERGFNIPLEEFDLSVRAFNNLKKSVAIRSLTL